MRKSKIIGLLLSILLMVIGFPSAFADDVNILYNVPADDGFTMLTDGIGSAYTGGPGTIYNGKVLTWTLADEYHVSRVVVAVNSTYSVPVTFYDAQGGVIGSLSFSKSDSTKDVNYTRVKKIRLDMTASVSEIWVYGSALIQDTIPPAVPAGLHILGTTPDSVILGWNPNTEPNLAGYQVFRDGTKIAELGSGVTTWENKGLNHDTSYFYSIRAFNSSGVLSDASPTVEANTKAIKDILLGVPVSIGDSYFHSAKSVTNAMTDGDDNSYAPLRSYNGTGAAFVRWDNPVGIFSFLLKTTNNSNEDFSVTFYGANNSVLASYRKSKEGKINLQEVYGVEIANLSISDLNIRTWELLSEETATLQDTVPPTTPTGIIVTASGPTQATVSWNANNEEDLAGYKVYRNGQLVATQSSTNFQDTSLAIGTTYAYQITAYDSNGNESEKSIEFTFTTPPAQVSFSTTRNPDGSTTVTGFVATPNGVPLPGIAVPLTVSNGQLSDSRPVSDSNGRFEVTLVKDSGVTSAATVGVDTTQAPNLPANEVGIDPLIFGNQPWTDTGIDISTGDDARVISIGDWAGRLYAKVGFDGVPVKVGADGSFVSAMAGRLYLGTNGPTYQGDVDSIIYLKGATSDVLPTMSLVISRASMPADGLSTAIVTGRVMEGFEPVVGAAVELSALLGEIPSQAVTGADGSYRVIYKSGFLAGADTLKAHFSNLEQTVSIELTDTSRLIESNALRLRRLIVNGKVIYLPVGSTAFEISNSDAVSVDKFGLIKAIRPGSATIDIAYKDNTFSYPLNVPELAVNANAHNRGNPDPGQPLSHSQDSEVPVLPSQRSSEVTLSVSERTRSWPTSVEISGKERN